MSENYQHVEGAYGPSIDESDVPVPTPDGVIVSRTCIDSMSDEQLGASVRALCEEVELMQSEAVAYHHWYQNRRWDGALLRGLDDHEASFENFADRSVLCRDALAAINEERERQQNRVKAKKTRSGIRTGYAEQFVAIGRRDGFKCAVCGSSAPDLQIDHIQPISCGGTNEMDNLQLLCSTCNRGKSDQAR